MNGIEKITQCIDTDTQAEIDRILNEARAQAAKITAQYQAQAEGETAELSTRSQKAAAEREERLVSVAQMEARKVTLGAKQEMVQQAYALALEKLCALPDEVYTETVAELLVQAAKSGRETVVFAPEDRARIGKAAVARANELLALAVAPKLPEELSNSRLGALLAKVAVGVTALAQGTAMLTLSEETRPLRGGFILVDENVEVNCTFDTLVRLQKAETAGAVVKRLFPEA